MAKLLDALGITKKAWLSANVEPAQQINQWSGLEYGLGATATVSTLLGTDSRPARHRDIIYSKWTAMMADPLCSSALKILVNTALGGHENTGQAVFIEKSPLCATDKRAHKIADEIIADLTPLLNKIAFTMCYTAAGFGDAYCRMYSDDTGIIDLSTDVMFRPPLIQAYQRGSRTVGYGVYVGQNMFERLDVTQLARMEMPRSQYVPQPSVIQKIFKAAVATDDINDLPITPSDVGGSLLYAAEPSYDNLIAGLSSMSAQRIRDAIDEAYLTLNMESMTSEQQKQSKLSVVEMLTKTKKVIDDAIASGKPFNSIIRHVMPIHNEKQITNITPMNSSRSATMTTDDIMFYARQTAAAIGCDLSNLGFSDQVTGSLGDGSLGQTSAVIAENSRTIRTAAIGLFKQIQAVHTLKRYGAVFTDANNPVQFNFYGSIAAFDATQQRTKVDSANSGMLLVQAIQMFKDGGANKEQMLMFLSKHMMLDEEEAEMYASIVDAKPPEEAGGDNGGGGFGDNLTTNNEED